jgi:hypothetical protein
MRRFPVTVAILAATALALVAAATAAADPQPRAELRGFACHRALDPPDRSVSLTAVMRPLAGTRHLSLKIDLLMSDGGSIVPKLVRAGDLGVWISPKTTSLGQLAGDVWNLRKQVVELGAPATYRFRVLFRWTGAHGHVIGSVVRYSPRCRQRELRPDLLVGSIAVSSIAGQPRHDLYTAVIANAGNTAAGPFDVLFAPADGSATQTHTVGLLGAHSSVRQTFVGPLCTASTAPMVTADSASQVDDLNRDNNAMSATCPAPAGS